MAEQVPSSNVEVVRAKLRRPNAEKLAVCMADSGIEGGLEGSGARDQDIGNYTEVKTSTPVQKSNPGRIINLDDTFRSESSSEDWVEEASREGNDQGTQTTGEDRVDRLARLNMGHEFIVVLKEEVKK